MKKLGCLLLLILNAAISSYAQRSQDSLALVALYNSTGGPNWTNKTNWLSSKPISDWYGINLEYDRVYSIYLDSNNMNGYLPVEIEKLSNLRYLVLFGNQLIGSIPKEIGNLASLEWLMLANNQFTGSIPKEIGNLNNLNTLWLYNNPLSGPLPTELWKLINLKYLIVNNAGISGTISSDIGNLRNLITLDFNLNQLIGSIPHEIGNIVTLNSLMLAGNKLTGNIPTEIYNLTNLSVLLLNDNQLTGALPAEIGGLTNLKTFCLNHNQFSGSIPTEINDLKFLKYIWLSENRFSSFPKLTSDSIDFLNIQNNQLTFKDIESNINIHFKYPFIYSPQDSIGIRKDTILNVGQDFTFTVICGGSYNQYQWFKDNHIIPSATSAKYIIPSLRQSDAGSYTCTVTNTVVAGLTIHSGPIRLHVSTITGLDDVNIPGIKIYPNPTSGIINIEIGNSILPSKIEVRDIYGKVVFQKNREGGNSYRLDLTNLKKGMYFIRIKSNSKNYIQKVIIR